MRTLKRQIFPELFLNVTLNVISNTFCSLFPTIIVFFLTSFRLEKNFLWIPILLVINLFFRLILDYTTKKSELLYQVLSEFQKTKMVAEMIDHPYSELQSAEIRTKLSNTLFSIDNQSLFIRYYETLGSFIYMIVTVIVSAFIISKVNLLVAIICVCIIALSIWVNQFKKNIFLKRTAKLLTINKGLSYFERVAQESTFLEDNKIYSLTNLLDSRFHKYTNMTNETLRQGMYKVAILDGGSSLFGIASLVVGAILLIFFSPNQNFSELSLAITTLFTFVGVVESSIVTYLQLQSLRIQLSSYFDLSKLEQIPVSFNDTSDFAVELENISYSYMEGKKIIDNLTMRINKGETVALVGENGSGKTTLIGIIAGILEPQQGSVSNGIDHKYAFVQQESIQFPETISENITVGNKKQNQKIKNVLRTVNLEEVLLDNSNRLNQKLNPRVNLDGVSLSGGQFQRLTIARGLYQESELLILDEPTASLDIRNEHTIFDTLSNLQEIETKVFISHRLTNCQIADTIYFLKGGKIVEVGNHNDLMAKKGEYYQLFSKQGSVYTEDNLEELVKNIN